ncbi:MAG: 4Fe-4S dicluster domain-containing protein [Planctomycetota bacterium]|jgi:ferredoxin
MKMIERHTLDDLFIVLKSNGYTLVGPTVRDQAIVYDEIYSIDDLPTGWVDRQKPGSYSLVKREDKALFGYAAGPQSWKKYLFPPAERLYRVSRNDGDVTILPDRAQAHRRALIGVRPCDVQAIGIQDRIFLQGPFADAHYRDRRDNVFILAVDCTESAATCFCASMNAGPEADANFDIALTEIIDDQSHVFLVRVGTKRGEEMIGRVRLKDAPNHLAGKRNQLLSENKNTMSRAVNQEHLSAMLMRNLDNRQWDDIAERCTSCANCTMVCPTCFCSTVEDVTDLTGDHAERWRRWDSCFTMDHSYIVGGSIRRSNRSRYRQWLTHKLGTWHDQFGSSGCVGCGRCITWCPVGIDLTDEVAAIREMDGEKVTRKRPV